MFNPEKMLGGLLRGGMGRSGSGLGALVKGGAALGLLGVAMEAVEHYMNKPSGTAAPGTPPPMPPPVGAGASVPPPMPGQPMASPPPPPPGGLAVTAPTAAPAGNAVLLIQAMIAAANADGVIDADERAAILNRLKSLQLSPEEHQFIMHELLDPKPMHTIVSAVTSPELARQVYLASILAITVDTDEEIDYLRNLAEQLGLDRETLATLHQQVGMEVIF